MGCPGIANLHSRKGAAAPMCLVGHGANPRIAGPHLACRTPQALGQRPCCGAWGGRCVMLPRSGAGVGLPRLSGRPLHDRSELLLPAGAVLSVQVAQSRQLLWIALWGWLPLNVCGRPRGCCATDYRHACCKQQQRGKAAALQPTHPGGRWLGARSHLRQPSQPPSRVLPHSCMRLRGGSCALALHA